MENFQVLLMNNLEEIRNLLNTFKNMLKQGDQSVELLKNCKI